MNIENGLNYYERHLGDYAKNTFHLSLLEHGVYTILLDRCFATCEPIPQEQAYRYACAKTRAEKRAVDAVLAEFFILQTGLYFSRLVQAYLEAKDKRAQTSKENGKLGGRPARKTDEMDKPNDNNRLENKKPNQNLTETYLEPNPNLKKPVPIAINPIANIYKSKAQQQQLSRPGASAAPLPTPGNGSLAENFPTQPQPKPKPQPPTATEPANGPQSLAGLLAKATKAITPEGAQPADPLPEPPAQTAAPESTSTAAQTAPVAASPAVDPDEYLRMWNYQLSIKQRCVLLDIAGFDHQELGHYAACTWWQFSPESRECLIQAIESLQQPQPDTAPAEPPESHSAAKPESVPAAPAVDPKTPQIAPATQAAPPPANPDSDLSALEAPLAHANDPDKGFIHADPKSAKNEANQTVSANPAQHAPMPLTEAAFLQTTLPQGVEIAVWHNFERMAREKVRWSAGTCMTLVRQLRQAIAAGADSNAVLEWATVRSLIDLPDAWQRMQADAAKKKAREQEENAASCGGNADALPTDSEPVNETLEVTVAEEVSEPVSEQVTGTDPLTAAVEKPKQNLKKPAKAKKDKTERGHRLPENWQPNDELMQWAEKEYPHIDAFKEADKFCDYWESKPGKEGRKLNWDKTFKNWMRNANEFTKSSFKSTGNSVAHLTPHASGRLPGESAADFSYRLYLEDQQKQAANGNIPVTGLFNNAPVLALLHNNGDTQK